jgi:hypothetical protein
MQKFYIHKEDKQQGPFSIDELKDLKISRDTMVWYEGADTWKKAIEVDDLKEIFKNTPPPLQTNSPVIPPPLVSRKLKEVSKPAVDKKQMKKKMTLIIFVFAILLAGGLVTFFINNQQAKQAEIPTENKMVFSKPVEIQSQKEQPNTQKKISTNKTNNSDDYSNWSGTYEDKYGSTLNVKGPSADGAVEFQLLQTSATCIGQIEGTAYLTKNGVANFHAKGDNCHVNFTFNPGSIQVSEYDCENYRGASCGSFDGFYNKK